jgi:predicted HicB family RNase H-like nuclease
MTQIGLRVPEELSDRLEAKAKEIGVSKNALVLILIDLGFKIYENVNFQAQSE